MVNSATMGTAKPLTGRKVLAILLSSFGVVFIVNGYMAWHAVSTFRGETADHPYEVGIKFNGELAKAEAQTARRWKVDIALSGATRVTFRDADGAPLQGLSVSGVFAAPADTKRDQHFALAEVSPGVYAGPQAPSGLWNLVLTAKRADAVLFEADSRLMRDVPALATQNASHWRVGLTFAGTDAKASVRDAEGRAVEGLTVAGLFAAPKEDRTRNRAFTAKETAPGEYAIDPAALQAGLWDFELEVRQGQMLAFRSRNRIELR